MFSRMVDFAYQIIRADSSGFTIGTVGILKRPRLMFSDANQNAYLLRDERDHLVPRILEVSAFLPAPFAT